jgi:hypothetical protein
MKLENQVCSPEQAAQLKTLGIAQELSLFHYLSDNRLTLLNNRGKYVDVNTGAHHSYWAKTAAFTGAELGEMLGSEVMTELEPGIEQHVWHCRDKVNYQVAFTASTEAQAKAEILIWLLETGHRTAEEVNSALAAN